MMAISLHIRALLQERVLTSDTPLPLGAKRRIGRARGADPLPAPRPLLLLRRRVRLRSAPLASEVT
eukprot:3941287-Rhodomonas_salina.1